MSAGSRAWMGCGRTAQSNTPTSPRIFSPSTSPISTAEIGPGPVSALSVGDNTSSTSPVTPPVLLCGAAIASISFAAQTLLSYRVQRGLPSQIIQRLSGTWAVASIMLLVSVSVPGSSTQACSILAALLQYTVFSGFCWFAVHAFHMCGAFVWEYGHFDDSSHHQLTWYALAGWGMPVIMLAITISTSYSDFRGDESTESMCWVSRNTSGSGAPWRIIAAPIAAMTFITGLCWIRLLWSLRSRLTLVTEAQAEQRQRQIRMVLPVFVGMSYLWLQLVSSIDGNADKSSSLQHLFFHYIFGIVYASLAVYLFVTERLTDTHRGYGYTGRVIELPRSPRTGSRAAWQVTGSTHSHLASERMFELSHIGEVTTVENGVQENIPAGLHSENLTDHTLIFPGTNAAELVNAELECTNDITSAILLQEEDNHNVKSGEEDLNALLQSSSSSDVGTQDLTRTQSIGCLHLPGVTDDSDGISLPVSAVDDVLNAAGESVTAENMQFTVSDHSFASEKDSSLQPLSTRITVDDKTSVTSNNVVSDMPPLVLSTSAGEVDDLEKSVNPLESIEDSPDAVFKDNSGMAEILNSQVPIVTADTDDNHGSTAVVGEYLQVGSVANGVIDANLSDSSFD